MTKLDHNQQRALLEYLDQEFHQRVREEISPIEHLYHPEPVHDGQPLEEESREWLAARWTGMRYWQDPESDNHGWSGQILGQRSDGQFFYVNMNCVQRQTRSWSCHLVRNLTMLMSGTKPSTRRPYKE